MTRLVKVNLGSGPTAFPGWKNFDRSPNVLLSRFPTLKLLLTRTNLLDAEQAIEWDREIVRRDLRRPLPLTSGSVDAIYSSHVLEHLFLDEARKTIGECFRVLKPGGVIRLALPDSRRLVRRLLEEDSLSDNATAGLEFNRSLLAYPESRPKGLTALKRRLSGHIHYWQPTPSIVVAALHETGFVGIEELEHRVGRLPDLELIETRPESFFVEALKPTFANCAH